MTRGIFGGKIKLLKRFTKSRGSGFMSKIFIVGSINMDLTINTDIVPDGGMTVTGYGFLTNPGGKGANQAVAVAKSGGDAVMVGCVGNAFGKELADTLSGYGVDASQVAVKADVSSGIAVIVVNDGENRIILDRGANAYVTPQMAEQALSGAHAGDYLVVQLEIPTETIVAALAAARHKGMTTFLNPAPAAVLPDDIWQYVDYFVPNQSETAFYTGIYPSDEATAAKAVDVLRKMGVGNVVITMGSVGAMAFVGSETVFAEACKVAAVDTTAAGDTFVGAMVTRLAEGATVREAMAFANKASSVTVTRKGAQQAIPYRNEIM